MLNLKVAIQATKTSYVLHAEQVHCKFSLCINCSFNYYRNLVLILIFDFNLNLI